MIVTPDTFQIPTAVVVAHPGHEVRVHRWLELSRPEIFILTDGSGRSGESRLAATSRMLTDMKIKAGNIYGNFTEQSFYNSVLNQELAFFNEIAEELAGAFKRSKIQIVVGDAAEGYNSTHDVCRLIIDAAVQIANCSSAAKIRNYDFLVVGMPDSCTADMNNQALWVQLDDDAFARKLEAAEKYHPELLEEVRQAVNGGSGTLGQYLNENDIKPAHANGNALDLFRVECLRPVNDAPPYRKRFCRVPFYEHHGERQQAAGFYQRTIRYREHLVPIAQSLSNHARGNC